MLRKLFAAALVASLAFLAAPLPAAAQLVAQGSPEELGFSSERLGRITTILREDTTKGMLPGAILLIARNGKIAYFEAVGALDPQTEAPMTKDAIFRIYSMTKPITSVAAMMLVEDGKLALADPVAKYIPEFKDTKVAIEEAAEEGKPAVTLAPARPIRVYDLIRHTSGLTYGVFGDNAVKRAYRESGLIKGDFDNAEFVSRIAKLPLMFQPGSAWEYSHATDVLGRVIEVASGKVALCVHEGAHSRSARHDGHELLRDRYVQASAYRRAVQATTAPSAPTQNSSIRARRSGTSPAAAGWSARRWTTRASCRCCSTAAVLGDKQLLGPKTIAMMTADHLGRGRDTGSAYCRAKVMVSASASPCARRPACRRFPAPPATIFGAAPAARISGSTRRRTCSSCS